MNNQSRPGMSVVIVTPDHFGTIRETIEHLQAQTARELLEIIIVAPSEADLGLDESALSEFAQFRVVVVGQIESTARVRAAGIRQASAPVIAMVEDHSFPEPRWAEALIEAHQEPWAAVGPVLGNANPATMTSWANLLTEYGPWLAPRAGGVVDHIPGHNSSYKRSIVLEYGPALEAMLEAETVLCWNLRSRGYELGLEPAARTNHLNFSRLRPSLAMRFHSGRLFAAARSSHWPWPRRLLFTASAPLIPFVRLWRTLGELLKPGRPRNLIPSVIPALTVLLAMDGLGEMVGYALGAGSAKQVLSDMEFRRFRYLTEKDKEMLASTVRKPL